jgi:molybdopterin/thiamine biosynthesis adenylyltransferase
VGVVGALTGVIGSMMALEAIKLAARAGEPLLGRILLFDGLGGQARTVTLARDPQCPACARA